MVCLSGSAVFKNTDIECDVLEDKPCQLHHQNITYFKGSPYEKMVTIGECVAGKNAKCPQPGENQHWVNPSIKMQ